MVHFFNVHDMKLISRFFESNNQQEFIQGGAVKLVPLIVVKGPILLPHPVLNIKVKTTC